MTHTYHESEGAPECSESVCDAYINPFLGFCPHQNDGKEIAEFIMGLSAIITSENWGNETTKVIPTADEHNINDFIKLPVGEILEIDYATVRGSKYILPDVLKGQKITALQTHEGWKVIAGPTEFIGKRPYIYNNIRVKKDTVSFSDGKPLVISDATPFKIHELLPRDVGPIVIQQGGKIIHARRGQVTDRAGKYGTYVDTTGKRVKILGPITIFPDTGTTGLSQREDRSHMGPMAWKEKQSYDPFTPWDTWQGVSKVDTPVVTHESFGITNKSHHVFSPLDEQPLPVIAPIERSTSSVVIPLPLDPQHILQPIGVDSPQITYETDEKMATYRTFFTSNHYPAEKFDECYSLYKRRVVVGDKEDIRTFNEAVRATFLNKYQNGFATTLLPALDISRSDISFNLPKAEIGGCGGNTAKEIFTMTHPELKTTDIEKFRFAPVRKTIDGKKTITGVRPVNASGSWGEKIPLENGLCKVTLFGEQYTLKVDDAQNLILSQGKYERRLYYRATDHGARTPSKDDNTVGDFALFPQYHARDFVEVSSKKNEWFTDDLEKHTLVGLDTFDAIKYRIFDIMLAQGTNIIPMVYERNDRGGPVKGSTSGYHIMWCKLVKDKDGKPDLIAGDSTFLANTTWSLNKKLQTAGGINWKDDVIDGIAAPFDKYMLGIRGGLGVREITLPTYSSFADANIMYTSTFTHTDEQFLSSVMGPQGYGNSL